MTGVYTLGALKLKNSNFYPLEVVSRCSDQQLKWVKIEIKTSDNLAIYCSFLLQILLFEEKKA